MANQAYLFNFSNKNSTQPILKNTNTGLTLYYFLYEQPGNVLNATETLFVTNPSNTGVYRGITNRFMSNSTYDSYTNDIISYISIRTPGSTNPGIFEKDMYNEILTINSLPYQDNYIQATCNYQDTSDDYATTVSENNFLVTAASGKFKNYSNIKITYDNTNPRKTRILEFS